MRFSENWLRSLVNPPFSRDQLIHELTMAGVEVECVDEVAPAFDNVVVAEVISIQKHPDADRLTICKVDAGLADDTLLQIVCGAPNVSEGIKVPCALVGASLPSGLVIKQSKLRGIESFGMLCSAQELGFGEKKEGLLSLPADAPVGVSFRDYYQLDDHIFSLKLTPNRADCLSVNGIAREVAAISDTSLHIPEYDLVNDYCKDRLTVNVTESEACPLYCGRIIRNITIETPTPLWMIHRLERSGIRTINIVVDILNYVMLEMGQPMHGFDLSKISNQLSGKIIVRFAQPNESLKLINGENLELQSDMLVIADTNRPVALAGIMGGLETSIQSGTTDVFLESAYFSPHVISGKSFKLGFNTDSAYRFERGVDFASTRKALERATQLILELMNDAAAGPITEVEGPLPQRNPVLVRLSKLQQILGINLSRSQVASILERLRFNFSEDNKGIFHISPPSYRFDLAIEVDFIEEIARIYGYDRIPVNLPKTTVTMLPESELGMISPSWLRNILALRDYQEVINYAFVDPQWELDFSKSCVPITLKNPIASQMSVMRTTLIGGLVANLQFNISRKQSRVRLFEIGCCFLRGIGDSYQQIEKIAGICYGDAFEEQWGVASRNIDYFDIKMDIESLCLPQQVTFSKCEHHAFHSGKSAQIIIDNRVVGWVGELHPRLQAQYDMPRPVILFELSLDSLIRKHLSSAKVLSKFPPVYRDIAIVISEHVTNDQLLKIMKDEQIHIVKEIYLFDYYSGKSLEKGKKSYAYRILLQDNEKTLTDQEVEAAILKLISVLQAKYDAKLRM